MNFGIFCRAFVKMIECVTLTIGLTYIGDVGILGPMMDCHVALDYDLDKNGLKMQTLGI
jgi:hypothetical protein